MGFWWTTTIIFLSWYVARFTLAFLQGVYRYRNFRVNRFIPLYVVFVISLLWPFVSLTAIILVCFISVGNLITALVIAMTMVFKEDTTRLYKTFDDAIRKVTK